MGKTQLRGECMNLTKWERDSVLDLIQWSTNDLKRGRKGHWDLDKIAKINEEIDKFEALKEKIFAWSDNNDR